MMMMKFSLVTLLAVDCNVLPTTLMIIMSLHKKHVAFVEEETYTLENLQNLQKVVKVTVASLVAAARLALQRAVVAHPVLERVVKAGVCKHDEIYFR